ncbi:MAG: peptidase M28, partial [Candidatus Sulfotelmatobacter sp.]
MTSALTKRPWIAAVALVLAVSAGALAQNRPDSNVRESSATESMAVDGRIAAALRGVSAERIRANIDKLVSFGTRSTISAQDPASIAAGRGIGAARDWIKSEFEL